jgi:carbon-monoxide dehydrogenase small subunit
MTKMNDEPVRLDVDDKITVLLGVEPRKLLVYTLRDDLDVTSVNIGCDTSQCGACTVEIDGESVKSCTVLTVQAHGAKISTAAGLASGQILNDLQKAFQNNHALQCGYCTPGMLISAKALLRANDTPSENDVREALKGNLCRCTGYQNIVKAVLDAARTMHSNTRTL